MFEGKKQKQMLIILIVIVVATLLIYFWSRGGFSFSFGSQEESLYVQPGPSLSPEVVKEEAMKILQDESFLQLKPHGEIPPIKEEQKGRPNPFKPS